MLHPLRRDGLKKESEFNRNVTGTIRIVPMINARVLLAAILTIGVLLVSSSGVFAATDGIYNLGVMVEG